MDNHLQLASSMIPFLIQQLEALKRLPGWRPVLRFGHAKRRLTCCIETRN